MADSVFSFDSMNSGGFGLGTAPKSDTAALGGAIEDIAKKTRVPINVLIASIERAGPGMDPMQVARETARRVRGHMDEGMDAEAATRAYAGPHADQFLGRAREIGSKLYPQRAAPAAPTPPEKQSGVIGDLGRRVTGAVVRTGGDMVEMTGRAIMPPEVEADMDPATGRPRDATMRTDPRIADVVASADRWRGAGEAISDTVSDRTKVALEGTNITGNLFKPSTWDMGDNPSLRGFSMLTADVLGSLVPVVATAIATRGAALPSMTVGGLQGGGAAADQAREIVEQAAADGILERESAYYRDLIGQGKAPDEALALTKEAAAQVASGMTLPVSMFGGAATARILSGGASRLVGGVAQGTLAGRVATGVVASGIEEGLQEVGEGVATRVGTEVATGIDQDPLEGSFAEFVLGAVGGASVGGLAGRPQRRTPDASDETPLPAPAEGQPTPQAQPQAPTPDGPLSRAAQAAPPPPTPQGRALQGIAPGSRVTITSYGATPYRGTFLGETPDGISIKPEGGEKVLLPRDAYDAKEFQITPDLAPQAQGQPAPVADAAPTRESATPAWAEFVPPPSEGDTTGNRTLAISEAIDTTIADMGVDLMPSERDAALAELEAQGGDPLSVLENIIIRSYLNDPEDAAAERRAGAGSLGVGFEEQGAVAEAQGEGLADTGRAQEDPGPAAGPVAEGIARGNGEPSVDDMIAGEYATIPDGDGPAQQVRVTPDGPWDFETTWPSPDVMQIARLRRDGTGSQIPFETGDPREVVDTLQETLSAAFMERAAAVEWIAEAKRIRDGEKPSFPVKRGTRREQAAKIADENAQTAMRNLSDVEASLRDIWPGPAVDAMAQHIADLVDAQRAAGPDVARAPDAKDAAPRDKTDKTPSKRADAEPEAKPTKRDKQRRAPVEKRAATKEAKAKPEVPDEGDLFSPKTSVATATPDAVPTAKEVAATARETERNPTPAQANAENYKTGKLQWNGLTLSIENAKGSMRRNVDPETGEVRWEVKMPAHYGRILRTVGNDGDHVDFYMGDNPDSDAVFVIDQRDAETGKFDEHKLMLGFKTAREAKSTYLKGFSDGKGEQRFLALTRVTVDEITTALAGDPDIWQRPWGKPAVPAKTNPNVKTDINNGKEVSTLREGITAIERRWLKREYEAGRLARKFGNIGNHWTYALPRADMTAIWDVKGSAEPSTPVSEPASKPAPEAKTDRQVMRENFDALAKDLATEFRRVEQFKQRAPRRSASKAKFQVKRLAEKYGISGDGYSDLDMLAGTLILNSVGSTTDYLTLARKVLGDFLGDTPKATSDAETSRRIMAQTREAAKTEQATADQLASVSPVSEIKGGTPLAIAKWGDGATRVNADKNFHGHGYFFLRTGAVPKFDAAVAGILGDNQPDAVYNGMSRIMEGVEKARDEIEWKFVTNSRAPRSEKWMPTSAVGVATFAGQEYWVGIDPRLLDFVQRNGLALRVNVNKPDVFAVIDKNGDHVGAAAAMRAPGEGDRARYLAALEEKQASAIAGVSPEADGPGPKVGDVWEYWPNGSATPSRKSIIATETRNGQPVFLVQVDGERTADIMNAEAVKQQKEIDAANLESRRKSEAKEAERAAAEAKTEAEQSDLDGFDADMTPMGRGRAIKVLNVKMNWGWLDGKTQTRRDAIRALVADGWRMGVMGSDGEALIRPSDEAYYAGQDLTKTGLAYARHLIAQQDDAAAPAAASPTNPTSKIEDFGEKLEGAAKDRWKTFAGKLTDVAADDVANHPLAKSWPEPDYQAMIDDGVDPWVVAFSRAAREEIPRKPGSAWKKKRWAGHVTELRGMVTGLLNGEIDAARARAMVIERIPRLAGRVDLYQEFGHAKSFAGLEFNQNTYSVLNGVYQNPSLKVWEVTQPGRSSAFSNMPRVLARGDTKEEAIDAFRAVYDTLEEGTAKTKARKGPKFVLYSKRGSGAGAKTFHIGVRRGRDYIDLMQFDDLTAARTYLRDNQDALGEMLAARLNIPNERRAENEARQGADHRGGADATPEMFSEAFGFRGVQFGNYVEGAKRQQDLNQAYDALMDMAGVLGIPPRAISLNGTLGLAFVARGKGGKRAAAAHYEPDTIVINLTKKSGAGSLGHEWWHAFDNYLSRARADNLSYLSERPYERGEGVRPEVVAAFKALDTALKSTAVQKRSAELDKRRSSPYWTQGRALGARSFESYLIEKMKREDESNDYLANIVDPEVWTAIEAMAGNEEPSYPYIEAAELPGVVDAYDALWAAMQTRETEAGTELFSRRPVSGAQTNLDSRVDDALAGRRPTEPVVVGRAPEVLAALGAPASPVVVMPGVIGKAKAKHRLTAEQIKSALQGIYDPVAVFDSAEAAHAPEGSFVVMVDAMAAGKQSVALAVHVDRNVGQTTVTSIASIHTRRASQIESWIEQRLLRYAGDRVGTWLSRLGLQLPRAVVQGRRKGDILHPEDVFNRGPQLNNAPAGPIFYSPALVFIESAKQQRAPAKDWKAILAKAPSVKKAELDWMGVDEWLDMQDGQVTREDLANFVRESQIEVVETFLAGDEIDTDQFESDYQLDVSDQGIEPDWEAEAEVYLDEAREELEARLDEDEDPGDITDAEVAEHAEELARQRWEPVEYAATLTDRNEIGPDLDATWDNEAREVFVHDPNYSNDDGRVDEDDVIERVNAWAWETHGKPKMEAAQPKGVDGPARHEGYTEPGGENYREVLLRMPLLHNAGRNAMLPIAARDELRPIDAEIARIEAKVSDPAADGAFHELSEGDRNRYSALTSQRHAIHSAHAKRGKVPFTQPGHFDEENIVVHARIKDRKGPNGEKVLFVEEIQSDLASKWREGTESPEITERRRELNDAVTRITDATYDSHTRIMLRDEFKHLKPSALSSSWSRHVIFKSGRVPDTPYSTEDKFYAAVRDEVYRRVPEARDADKLKDELLSLGTAKTVAPALPDTPFKEDATYQLMVKRLLRMAAEEGYDRLAWTPGYMQAERWNNAAQSVVEDVTWTHRTETEGEHVVDVDLNMADGGGGINLIASRDTGNILYAGRDIFDGKNLRDAVGPSLAAQMLRDPSGTVTGEKITFPDSGYAIAYDQQTKRAVDKFARRHGAKVAADKNMPDFRPHHPAGEVAQWVKDHDLSLADVRQILTRPDGARQNRVSGDAIDRTARPYLASQRSEDENWVAQQVARQHAMIFAQNADGFEVEANPVWVVDITPDLRKAALEPQPILRATQVAEGDLSADLRRDFTTMANAELERVGIASKVRARLVQVVARIDAERYMTVSGSYRDGTIKITPTTGTGVMDVLHHEIIHALRDSTLWHRDYGLFEQAEWRALARAARAHPGVMADVEARYGDLSTAQQTEEAVAELYRLWRRGEATYDMANWGRVAPVLQRMASFFEALGNALRGLGFVAHGAIFERIAKGEIGARAQFRDAQGRFEATSTKFMRDFVEAPAQTEVQKDARERKFIGNLLTRAMSGNISLLSLVPGRALYAELGRKMPSAKTYLHFKEKMDQVRNDWHVNTGTTARIWGNLLRKNGEANKRMMDLMHRSTIAGIDPAEQFKELTALSTDDAIWAPEPGEAGFGAAEHIREVNEQRRQAYGDLRAEFEALPEPFQRMFSRVRADHEALGLEFEKAITENAEKAMALGLDRAKDRYRKALDQIRDDGLTGAEKEGALKAAKSDLEMAQKMHGWNKRARLAALRKRFETNKVEGPYFPLMRFGNFFVTLRDAKSGEVVSFSKFENERTQMAMVKDYENDTGVTVEFGVIGEEFDHRSQVDPGFVADVEEIIGSVVSDQNVMDEIWQRWLQTLPDYSVRRSRLHRKGTPGYGPDAYRAYARQMFHGAHQLARLKYAVDLERSLENARKEAAASSDPNRNGLIVDEMGRRHQYVMNPKGSAAAQVATSAAFVYYLGFSPSSAIVNLSQTTVVGIPVLTAGFEKGNAATTATQLGKALRDFAGGLGYAERSKTMTVDERAAMQEAYDRGIVDKSQAHDLTAISDSGIEYKDSWAKAMEKVAYLFHHAERLNREVTFLAAYRMARDNDFAHETAIDKAGDLTYKTHFDYQNCVDDRTEILTLAGWKKWDQLAAGDRVISTDDDGRAIETGVQAVNIFERPQEIALFEAKGSRRFSMAVTDNHKCVALKQRKSGAARGYTPPHFVEARELDQRHYLLRAPLSPLERPDSIGTDMAALIGWFSSEGWYARNRGAKVKNNVRIEQSLTKNPEHVAEIDGILDRLGGGYSRHLVKGGAHVLWSLNGDLAKAVQAAVPDKVLPWSLMETLSAAEMSALLEAFAKGDGTRQGKNGCITISQKASTNHQNLEVLQAMATVIGKTASVGYSTTRDMSWLTMPGDGRIQTTKTAVAHLEQSRHQVSRVWCPTTDNGRWIARRNGCVFVTGNSSRPRVLQNDWLRVFMVFRNFQINMLWRLFRDSHQMLRGETPEVRREARRQLIGISASMMAQAGITGTWGYSLLLLIMSKLGLGEEDEIEEEIKSALVNTLGTDVAGMMLGGVPGHLLGVDLTSRIGMPELWLRKSDRMLEGEDVYTYWLLEFIGAVPNMIENTIKGVQRIADGEVMRGLEVMSPKFARDGLQAMRYATEGVQTFSGSDYVEDVSVAEALVKAIGFQPARISERYTINNRLINAEKRITQRRRAILKDARESLQRDRTLSPKLIDHILDFNIDNPDFPITADSINRSLSSSERFESQREGGVRLNPRLNQRLRGRLAQPIYD